MLSLSQGVALSERDGDERIIRMIDEAVFKLPEPAVRALTPLEDASQRHRLLVFAVDRLHDCTHCMAEKTAAWVRIRSIGSRSVRELQGSVRKQPGPFSTGTIRRYEYRINLVN